MVRARGCSRRADAGRRRMTISHTSARPGDPPMTRVIDALGSPLVGDLRSGPRRPDQRPVVALQMRLLAEGAAETSLSRADKTDCRHLSRPTGTRIRTLDLASGWR